MWFHNNHISLYWTENHIYACIRMLRTPNTPGTFTEEGIL